MKKFFQYIKIVIPAIPVIIFYELFYISRFARNPNKYELSYRYKIVQKYFRFILKCYGIDYKTFGLEQFNQFKSKRLLISNHLSTVDPIVYISICDRPIVPVAKKEAFKYPFIGSVIKALGGFSLDRSNVMKQIGEIKRIVQFLKSDEDADVLVFAEGTRQRDASKHCLPFHAGTFKIASMAGVPICSIATFGSFRPFGISHYLRKYPIWMDFGVAKSFEDIKDIPTNELADAYEKFINNKVDEFRNLDRQYIYSSKVTTKRKALETIVDMRVDS